MSIKQYISAFLVLSFLILPLNTKAQSNTESSSGTTTDFLCYTFNTNLVFGSSGKDIDNLVEVLKIEKLLNTTPTVFDFNVYLAVKNFQVKHKIVKYGTGFVGPLTRAELNKIYGCAALTSNGSSDEATNSQVSTVRSFSSTPRRNPSDTGPIIIDTVPKPVIIHKTDSEILAGLVQMLRDHTCAVLVNVAPHCDANFDFNSDGKTASHEVLIMLQILTTNDENFDNAYKDIMSAIDARMNKINTDEGFESAFDVDRDKVITPFDKNKISEVLIGSRVYPPVVVHTPRRNPSDTGPIIIDTTPKPVIIHKTESEILSGLVQMLRDHTCAPLVNVAPHCDENFDFNSDGKTASHEALVMLQIHTTSDQSFENAYTDIMSAIDARMNKINTDEGFESAFDVDRDNVITPFDKDRISEVLIGSRTYPQIVMSSTFSSGSSEPIEDTQTETTNSENINKDQSETTTETIDEKKEGKLEETANAEVKRVEEVADKVIEEKVEEVVVDQKTEVEVKVEVEVKTEEPTI